MREKVFNKYNKKARLYNIEMLQNHNKFDGFNFSNRFFKCELNCLINHKLKIVIARSSDLKYCNNIDYHFITYKNPDQLINERFINEVNSAIKRNTWILNRANELNENLPKSEIWFNSKLKDTKYFKEMNFKKNQIFRSLYICDLISLKYKTIIEIDGSIHDLPEQKLKDEEKDIKYLQATFNIIRVKHNDEVSFNDCLNKLDKIIQNGLPFNSNIKLNKNYNNDERVFIRSKIKINKDHFKSEINKIDFNKKLPF